MSRVKRARKLVADACVEIVGQTFELRFDVAKVSWRLTYWFASDRRIVLLTVFRKQRQNERLEVQRARWALTKCFREHTAKETK
jgi:Phage derived protein Gp49-like (DUF891)